MCKAFWKRKIKKRLAGKLHPEPLLIVFYMMLRSKGILPSTDATDCFVASQPLQSCMH